MKRIIVLFAFLVAAIVIVSCQKESDVVPNSPLLSQKDQNKERVARNGPGYTWELSTPNQNAPGESYTPPSGEPQFYLKQSQGYTRQVTLTVKKTGTTTANPAFRIFKRYNGCFVLGGPVTSMGTTEPIPMFQQDPFSSQYYEGRKWTVPLGVSSVNSVATYTFYVTIPSTASCVEGYIGVDMIEPTIINTAFSYWDGDTMYFVKSST